MTSPADPPVRDGLAGGASPDDLRRVMADFASGVTIVSALVAGPDGPTAHAMTATAVSSVSLDPPLVLVCVNRTSRFHAAVLRAGEWALSILSAGQEDVARHFANRGRDLLTQFDAVAHVPGPRTGAPLISGAATWMECVTESAYEAGDHTIVVGRLLSTAPKPHATDPLTYHRGVYLPLATPTGKGTGNS